MADRMSHGKSRASLFQSRVLIEVLEARQFLTAAPSGQITAAVRADPAVTTAPKAIQATSPVSAQPPESAREEVEDSAPPTSNAASKTSAVNSRTSNAEVSAGNNMRAAASPSPAEDDSAPVAASERSSDTDTKRSVSGSAENDDALSAQAPVASSIKTSPVTAESQSAAPADSSPAETVTSPQDAIREAASAAEQSVGSILAEHDGVSARALFNTSLVSEEWMDAGNLKSPPGADGLISDSAAIGQAIQTGKGLVLETALFSSKTILNQLSVLPGALANLGMGANGGAEALGAGPLKTAAAPFFYIPRINWVGAVSDAWESFARESLVLPLADSGRVKAWAVTAMVGAADAVLAGYWIRSRNRRKKTFCTGAVLGGAAGLLE